ncbi:MAG: hypothetical protein NTX61_01795 [Bacteroidetes bacterium]|nr:hypothetical protein [Bacteroidota bacterium]
MATNLNKLKVSLTKHGAHKIADLLLHFDKDDILNHLDGDYMDINIDAAQTRAILSLNAKGNAPDLWNEIKKYGLEDIFDLVFIAIVFSHVDFINALKKGISDGCIIRRGDVIAGKVYTNFAHIVDQFGFVIEHSSDYFTFDISRIFYKYYIPELVTKLLNIKLTEAGWDKQNSLVDECIRLDLNHVFGLEPNEFREWLSEAKEFDDQQIERVKSKRNFATGIKFKSGHNSKFEGIIDVKTSTQRTATLLHNKIQNEVYKILVCEYPNQEVGTEVHTNFGSIDIVRKFDNCYIFYEIKTSHSIKSNIRQGLSQLLEYAYWNEIQNITELIIIGPSPSIESSRKYLQRLRTEFKIPVYFRCYDLDSSILGAYE